jgi:hypothetical protein
MPSVTERLAIALDRDDYAAATKCLATDCRYETAKQTFCGLNAVLQSFREASEWAHANLEEIVFTHSIEPCPDCTAVIRFVDHIRHGSRQLRHECLMHVTVDTNQSISRLRLEDLPGEPARVAEFMTAIGLSRK